MEEVKMLMKLIVVNFSHFIRYSCTIGHFLDSQTLSEYISTIVLDVNKKLPISEVLDVLIDVGTFTSTSSFRRQILQLVTMNELKMSVWWFATFSFWLVFPCSGYFLLEFKASWHNTIFVGRWGKCICL